MKEYLVTENTTLKKFTDNTSPQASFCFSRLLKEKSVKVNGERVSRDMPLKKGDRVTFYLTQKEQEKPCFLPVYEDENLLIVDKESGVNSEALFSYLSETQKVFFIHRLDRNTTGLIVFAKNENAKEELLAAFKDRRVEKKYLALTFGAPKNESGTLTAFLRKDEKTSTVSVSENENGGEKILTEYRVLSRGEVSLLEVTLHTGKTHQIRAHLAHIACPIVGDEKYGDSKRNAERKKRRQCLHAQSLKFNFLGSLSYLNGKTFISSRKLDFVKN